MPRDAAIGVGLLLAFALAALFFVHWIFAAGFVVGVLFGSFAVVMLLEAAERTDP